MANQTDPFAQTVHGTNPQYLVEKITRLKIYNASYWKEECFGLTAATIIDKAAALKYCGGLYGGNLVPTKFLCLVLKLLQLQPEKDIVLEFIRNEDFKYVRALGVFYLRLVGKAEEIYNNLEPIYNDYRKLAYRGMDGWRLVYMDEFVDSLLREELVCDIAMPHMAKREKLEALGSLQPRESLLEEELLELEAMETRTLQQGISNDSEGLEEEKFGHDDGSEAIAVRFDDDDEDVKIVVATRIAIECPQPSAIKQGYGKDTHDQSDGDKQSSDTRTDGDTWKREKRSRSTDRRENRVSDRNRDHRRDKSRNRDRDSGRRRDSRSRDRYRSESRCRARSYSRSSSSSMNRRRRDGRRRADSRARHRDRRSDESGRRHRWRYSSESYSDDSRRDRSKRRRREYIRDRDREKCDGDEDRDRKSAAASLIDKDRDVVPVSAQSGKGSSKPKMSDKAFDRIFGKVKHPIKEGPAAAGSGNKVITNSKGEKVLITAPEGSVDYWNQIRESLGMSKLKT
jgi:pre-mRNA-splicing factor 38A